MNRYWKADEETSARIIEIMQEWHRIVDRGRRLSAKHGGSRLNVYTSSAFSRMEVSGFIFKDESKVDKKLFMRVKGTRDGWRPKRNKSDLSKEFDSLNSNVIGMVSDLIGMKLMFGLTVRRPGIVVKDCVAYLTLPDDVTNPNGCSRISDLEYEAATKPEQKSRKKSSRSKVSKVR